nr:immunoglobulin heavy chain junction region [Macaca mulatta]MOY22165.1 immunoglobulin heavy chain junction region [Macaca mulatta]MOY22769.1 immunoglobulin heavy chain junction region [Macaca mulatta]MOY24036.1 immunoglobulin heavy chain junction region [Macaca mulatta]MOY24189.1 immunoglobulin heavy chain junction region [Macaca mulatta]
CARDRSSAWSYNSLDVW